MPTTTTNVIKFYRYWLVKYGHQVGKFTKNDVLITELLVKTIERRYLELLDS